MIGRESIEEQGKRSISTKIEESELLIDLRDNGKGIPPENLAKVTEPFFTTKAPQKGTGLGLSICLSIIKEHKGVMEISSELNEGAQVSIKLPLSSS